MIDDYSSVLYWNFNYAISFFSLLTCYFVNKKFFHYNIFIYLLYTTLVIFGIIK